MKKNKSVGRPQIEINWDKLDAALQFGARMLDCCGLLDTTENTINKYIMQKHGVTFSEYRELKMSTMRTKLLQKQFDVAMSGNVVMLIWLGKQHLHQVDKVETGISNATLQQLSVNYKLDK